LRIKELMRCTTGIISVIIVITSAFMPVSAENGIVFSGEEDTLSLYNRLSSILLKDPSGENSCRNIIKLMEISTEAGREKTAKLFRRCAGQIKDNGEETSPAFFLLINYAEKLERGHNDRESLYKGIDKWLICGPWQKFGRADIYYPFSPESDADFSEFKSIMSREYGSRIYPFGLIPERRGIVYAAASFSVDIPVRIWILSNAEYRFFVNRVEVTSSDISGTESLTGVNLKGCRDYTILLKIADNYCGNDPFFRIIITDVKNNEINPDITGLNFYGKIFHEEIFSSGKMESVQGFTDVVKMKNICQGINGGDYDNLYNEAKSLLSLYPLYRESYHAIIPILIRDRREREFIKTIAQYKERFPDSDYYAKWEAEFYCSSDDKKFEEAMDKIHLLYCSYDAAQAYIKYLFDRGDKKAAKLYYEKFKDIPSFRGAEAEIEKSLSAPEQWRKFLLEKAALTGDPLYYYYLGNADMDIGLDPVLYWEKGLSIRSDMRELREATDIFENGKGSGNIFYSGRYTDYHPEFLWNGIKRKVTVRIFPNGKYMTECEELIPADLAEKGEFSLIKLKDIRVLYALRCSGGEAFPLEYKVSEKNESVSLKMKKGDKSDFFVLKYTGYSTYDQYPFYLVNDLELKHADEALSEILFEVISEGVKPVVKFMEKPVPGKSSGKEGETIYRISEKFNFKNSGRVTVSAAYISGDREFSIWYNSMLKLLKKKGSVKRISKEEESDLLVKISAVQNYINKKFKPGKGINFKPRFPAEMVFLSKGTSEELAVLASAIIEKEGIKGFIAFIREKGERISSNSEAALFIPESKGRGIWVRFADRKKYKNPEALLITGDNFEIIPVRDK